MGSATLAFIEETLLLLDIQTLELQVEVDNIEARAFYQRAGFISHDRTPMSKAQKLQRSHYDP
jgi:ribosomal protein S18 acetylase RimI-like enzyme